MGCVGARDCVLSEQEVADLRLLDVSIEDNLSVTVYRVAHILGKHFRSGEWVKRRCGSVITCVMSGRSVYATVKRFFEVDQDDSPGYASVTLFGVPEYPAYPNPVLVRCREVDPDGLVEAYGCVVPITQIEPTQVMVEREEDHEFCWMMRDSGYDTLRGH